MNTDDAQMVMEAFNVMWRWLRAKYRNEWPTYRERLENGDCDE